MQLNLIKIRILLFLRIFINMRPKLKETEKRIKLSITLSQKINKQMDQDVINKSKLIEKLLMEYYGKKNM